MLRGHAAPIFYLFIADDDNRIFSISTDRCIKVLNDTDMPNVSLLFHNLVVHCCGIVIFVFLVF